MKPGREAARARARRRRASASAMTTPSPTNIHNIKTPVKARTAVQCTGLLQTLLGSNYLEHRKRCAEGIVRNLQSDFAFWQVQNPQNFHIGPFRYCQNRSYCIDDTCMHFAVLSPLPNLAELFAKTSQLSTFEHFGTFLRVRALT